jgi:hypothetical protein
MICSGRHCKNQSVGSFYEVKEVPKWRCVDDRPENECQFDLVTEVHYCAEHEQVAKAYAQMARDYVLSTCL